MVTIGMAVIASVYGLFHKPVGKLTYFDKRQLKKGG